MKSSDLMVLLLFSGQVLAGALNTEEDTQTFADSFISKILKEEFQEAVGVAKQFWPLPAVAIDGIVNKVNQQWPIVGQRFGGPVATESVRKERIRKSFMRQHYLHKFEHHTIYWRLDFYKPHQDWKVNRVVFLDSLDVLYEQADNTGMQLSGLSAQADHRSRPLTWAGRSRAVIPGLLL